MEYREILNLFAQVGMNSCQKYEKKLTDEEWAERGVKSVKRKALGFCGLNKTVNLEEMISLLVNTGLASSREDGGKLVPSLLGKGFNYGLDSCLYFIEISRQDKEKFYKIIVGGSGGV